MGAAAFLLVFGFSGVSYTQSGMTAIRDIPFSANEWITRTSPASDGALTVTTQQIAIARASDGTVRREIHEASAGTDRVVGRPILLVSILNQETKTNSAIVRGKAAVTAMELSGLGDAQKVPATKTVSAKSANVPTSTEVTSLSGLQAIVYRSQYTVPASDPKDKETTVTSEIWYSPELHVPLKSSLSDSRGGTVVSILAEIQRHEPDTSLFPISTEATTAQK